MRTILGRSALSFALVAGLIGGAAWSPTSYACAETPVLASICIMATPSTFGDFNSQYSKADGRTVAVGQNQALFSLIGASYGGDGKATFALPDMRGRFLLGSGNVSNPQLPQAESGQKGGSATVTLTQSQLPAHVHTFTNVTVDFSKVTATTTLGTMAVSMTGNAALKGSSATGNQGTPSGNYLGTTVLGSNKIYADSAPSTASLNAASIDTSNLKVALSGAPATTLSGTSGASGTTAVAGSSAPFPVLPPYLAMTYYIATKNALYPSRD
ncbi:microcystin dependent protein [Ferrigenium kumadai]|uniref:Microcystin dependent protein n=1 Tax=Ferrigenium kumadai TaxID=1682490 RepID=A0AAN1T1F3_9PROT|nr:tail fiber protein [Ferrigenium kumadai]BBI99624.1 microcystin dependent protein [Ferrigenium kumadai]